MDVIQSSEYSCVAGLDNLCFADDGYYPDGYFSTIVEENGEIPRQESDHEHCHYTIRTKQQFFWLEKEVLEMKDFAVDDVLIVDLNKKPVSLEDFEKSTKPVVMQVAFKIGEELLVEFNYDFLLQITGK